MRSTASSSADNGGCEPVAAVDDRASWIVTTTTQSVSRSYSYTSSIHRQGSSRNRSPDQEPASSRPSRGELHQRREAATNSITGISRQAQRSGQPLEILDGRSGDRDVGHAQSSSSVTVSPLAACRRPSCVRCQASSMPSRTDITVSAVDSASSIAVDSNERASVPSLTCTRFASRASLLACSSSRVMLRRWVPRG